MINRIWHGWTAHENAKAYENLLNSEVFPSIARKKVKGYKKITFLKRVLDDEVEFVTIMVFDDIQSVKEFAGVEYERSYVSTKAAQLLIRFDLTAQHYEVLNELKYS